MDALTPDSLLLFIAFVIPGFVSLKTYEALALGSPRDTSQQIIDAIAFSCLNYAVLSVAIVSVEASGVRSTWPWCYGAFWFFVLFISPIGLTSLAWKLRHSKFILRTLPHPVGRPWDFVFSQRRPFWVIAKLKDGSKVAGRYDSESFASSTPQPEQIYLEEAWHLNDEGGFDRPRTETAGIIVLASEIVAIELFHLTRREGNGRQETTVGGVSTNGEEGLSAVAKHPGNTKAAGRLPTGERSKTGKSATKEAVNRRERGTEGS